MDDKALARAQLALGMRNVQAFYRLIRETESNQIDQGPGSAYTLINGGAHFTDFSKHPFEGLLTTQGGRAAGAAQFIPSTWGDMKAKYGLADFSPRSQDIAFIGCLEKRRALDDVMAGEIPRAIEKCRLEWTSLPAAAESRRGYTLDQALATYQKWGGRLATQEAAPIEEAGRPALPAEEEAPMAPLLIPLATALLQGFAGFAQEKVGKALNNPQVGEQLASGMIETVKVLTGKPDPIDAVAAARADPALMAKVQESSMDHLDKLLPLIDKLAAIDKQTAELAVAGKDAAAKRGLMDRWDMTRSLVHSSEGLAWAIVVLGAVLVGVAIFKDKWEVAMSVLAAVGGWYTLILRNRSQAYDYRFDGTPTSNAVEVAKQAVRQPQ